jgi:hypothetical protein
MYVNVGALDISGDMDFPTKSSFKELFRTHPELVVLYTTSAIEPSKEYTSDELVIGVKYSVVGPNPYTSRKWYATVEKGQNGKITVK